MIQKIRDSNFRVILLTREYGKISCWHKTKNCWYDIGDIINISIERVGTTNTIKNVDHLLSTSWKDWNYAWVIGLLDLLYLLSRALPDSMPHPAIFDDYQSLLSIIQWWPTPESYHFILLKVRVLKILWILNPSEIHTSPKIKYIYNNIRNVSIHALVWSKILDDITIKTLKETIDISIESFN